MGGGTPSTTKGEYWDGDIDWYAPAEIANQIYVSSSQKKITQAGYDNSSAKMLPVGTVLFTSRAGIGKTAILAKKGCTNQGFQSIVPHEGQLDSYFIFSRTGELKKYGETTGAGSTFVEVSGKQMARMELLMPPTMSEQQAIGRFFASLDSTITLHQRKLDSMKLLKKSLLQKMFPKSGEPVPDVNCTKFTDVWEQRKFGSQYQKLNEKNDLTFGPDKIISVANMYFKADTTKSDDAYLRTYNVMRLGDIAFEGNKSKNFAHGRFVENTIGDGIVSHVFDVFRPISEYDLLFWKYLINNENIMGRVMTRCTKASTMMTNLVAKDFLNESISIPSLEEQRKIGAFLDCLDQTITLHQRKVESLQKLKKSLLQQMFV